MELIVKGRFNGDVNSLPSGQLKNHPDAITEFLQEVQQKYGEKMKESEQLNLFDIL